MPPGCMMQSCKKRAGYAAGEAGTWRMRRRAGWGRGSSSLGQPRAPPSEGEEAQLIGAAAPGKPDPRGPLYCAGGDAAGCRCTRAHRR